MVDEQTGAKRMACIECRQQKVRCDSHECYPNPCTRCTKKNTECLLQADFKRTSKRKRMAELEEEMEKLRQGSDGDIQESKKRIATGSLLELSNTALQLNNDHTSKHDLPAASYVPKVEESPAPYQEIPRVENLKCAPKTMEGVTLEEETIRNLFTEFTHNYHPFLPVVDVTKGPEQIYRQCPSLFWTIMAVASRRYDRDGGLMMRLAPLLKNCLGEVTISPVTRFVSGESNDPNFNVASVYSVQAFLIYTMWPPLTSSISADSSWNAAGVAIFSGIRVGLHCPGYSRDFSRIKADNPNFPKIAEQIKTWVCCNVVSQCVATVFGFPSFTTFDAGVVSACSQESSVDVPECIQQMMMIQQLENEIEKTLNSNSQDPLGLSELSERLSLIQIMNRKLDELEMKLGALDGYRKFLLLASRVHLMTYYFLDNGGFSTLQLQKGLVQAYNSAIALLHHTDQVIKTYPTFMQYLPGIHVQALWQSTSIIIKVYHSSFSEFVDANIGKELYFRTVQHLSSASILKHDMAYRGAEIMQQIWQLFEDLSRRNAATSRISIRTRMAASVFFDILWTMREECGIRSVAPTVLKERNTDNTVPSPQPVYAQGRGGSQQHQQPPPNLQPQFRQQYQTQQPAQTVQSQGGNPQAQAQSSQTESPSQTQVQSQSHSQFDIPIDNTGNQINNPLFDWDMDLAWRDVDLMMTDLGFQAEEVGLGQF